MTAILTQDDVMQSVDFIYGQVIYGIPHVSKSIHVLATDHTTGYANDHTAAKKMINNQITKCTVSGVLSGIDRAIVLPITIPIDVGSSLYVQMKMIACTAKINQKVGFRFLTKFGETGVIDLGKLVPGVGAIIGGGLNMAETKVIGDRAYKFFALGDTSAMSKKKLAREKQNPKSIDISALPGFLHLMLSYSSSTVPGGFDVRS